MDACGLLFLLASACWLVVTVSRWLMKRNTALGDQITAALSDTTQVTNYMPDELWERGK